MKIIAESASNHNGDHKYLIELARAAQAAGADYFTAQVVDPDAFCTSDYAGYETLKKIAIRFEDWLRVFDACKDTGIPLIPCVLDENTLELCYDYGFRFIKLHASDITNVELLRRIAAKGDCKVLLETQCSTLVEIDTAVAELGQSLEAIVHGFSNYPTEVEDLQLNALDMLREAFPSCDLGFADHSRDKAEVPLMVLAKGVAYLEKHITLSRRERRLDWQTSLYPEEFATMVSKVRHYQQALGKRNKHIGVTERGCRDVLIKKFDPDTGRSLRSPRGSDYVTHKVGGFAPDSACIAIIARLKSTRLKEKVLLPMAGTSMIDFLYRRMLQVPDIRRVAVATSYLPQDDRLASYCEQAGMDLYRGHPDSVLDRVLLFAIKNECRYVFRITADCPLMDFELMSTARRLAAEHNLDYVRVNNAPLGVGGEVISVPYLWKLYLSMDDTMQTEYLSWFIFNDDTSRKGAVVLECSGVEEARFCNLSVDVLEDYERVLSLLSKFDGSRWLSLSAGEIIGALGEVDSRNADKEVKLPDKVISLRELMEMLDKLDYVVTCPVGLPTLGDRVTE